MAKGWKNESRRHSLARRGIKTAQKLSMAQKMAMTKNLKLKDSDGDKVADKFDCQPFNPKMQDDMPVTEIEFDPSVEGDVSKTKKVLGKVEARALSLGKKGVEFGKSKLEELKEKKKEQKIEELETVKHPLAKDLTKQRSRVETLKTQIAEATDENKEEKLFDELAKEQEQLRELQEKITQLNVVDLSDRELKTLAIRHKEGIFGGNPYRDELKRRIASEKRIEKELAEERKKPISSGLFDF